MPAQLSTLLLCYNAECDVHLVGSKAYLRGMSVLMLLVYRSARHAVRIIMRTVMQLFQLAGHVISVSHMALQPSVVRLQLPLLTLQWGVGYADDLCRCTAYLLSKSHSSCTRIDQADLHAKLRHEHSICTRCSRCGRGDAWPA